MYGCRTYAPTVNTEHSTGMGTSCIGIAGHALQADMTAYQEKTRMIAPRLECFFNGFVFVVPV